MKLNNLEKFLEKVKSGNVALGGVVTFFDEAVTELACEAGFDFVWIDGEHGEFQRETAMRHLMAVRGTGAAAFYRVPCCDHAAIKSIIDFAPAGIIVPMVMDEEDARRAVSYCRYPVHGGTRGFGPRRAVGYGTGDMGAYIDASAHDPLVIIQLEHIDAVRRLDGILAVPGIDAVLVGPYDLTMSMGKPGAFDDPEVLRVFDESCAKIRAKGVLLGCYTEKDFAAWRRRGVQFMGIKNDYSAMLRGFREIIAEAGGFSSSAEEPNFPLHVDKTARVGIISD